MADLGGVATGVEDPIGAVVGCEGGDLVPPRGNTREVGRGDAPDAESAPDRAPGAAGVFVLDPSPGFSAGDGSGVSVVATGALYGVFNPKS